MEGCRKEGGGAAFGKKERMKTEASRMLIEEDAVRKRWAEFGFVGGMEEERLVQKITGFDVRDV